MNSTHENNSWMNLQFDAYPWLWEVFTIILMTAIASFVIRSLFTKLQKQLLKTSNLWDDALLESVRRPAFYMIWLLGLSWVLEILVEQSQAVVFSSLTPIRQLLVGFLLCWFLLRLIRQVEQRLIAGQGESAAVDQTTVLALGKLVRITIIITASLVAMQTLGYSISGVLAFGGVGGIAVGFAAKDLLSNFFGGLMIYLDRPFAVGDWIRSPDREIEGTVEHIGWRQTRIRTFDKRPLYVPNATFAQISVENPSRMENRRIYETIGLRYQDADKIPAIIEAVIKMLNKHPDIDQSQTIIVNFNGFSASSLDFFIYTFTKTTDWVAFHGIKQRVLLSVLKIISEQGADIAFPTRELIIPDEIALAATSGSSYRD